MTGLGMVLASVVGVEDIQVGYGLDLVYVLL
jgi:hypothetical protein